MTEPSVCLIPLDSFRCHISESTKKQLKQANLDTAVVPGGCTKFVQAPDVCWNSPFKAKIRELYDDWMVHGEKNLRLAGILELLQWPSTTYNRSLKREMYYQRKSSSTLSGLAESPMPQMEQKTIQFIASSRMDLCQVVEIFFSKLAARKNCRDARRN
uniref:DDE-1 domain-containing protein n=1 Tax=Ditylenchus dipsaci TaxID=166011 RepID=A0A915E8H4_9BILA